MLPIYALSMVMLSPGIQGAQEHAASTHGCGCGEVLAFVQDYVERNYAGFPNKVREADRKPYEEHKAAVRARAGEAAGEAECHGLLREYIGFFRDPHLSVSYRATPAGYDQGRTPSAGRPLRQVSEPEVRGYLDRAGDELSPVEGIWEIVGADYRIAVIPDGTAEGRYEAVILKTDAASWAPGQIKATLGQTAAGEYRVDYYMGDHSLREETARYREGLLVFSSVSSWARVYPDNVSGYDPERYRAFEGSRELEVRALDADTLLLRLPDFGPTVQSRIDAVIEENWGPLTTARNLIIDVRGNPGGSNTSFASVRPLLYTGPVVLPGMSHYATDDNIRTIEAFLENVELAEDLEAQIQEVLANMREHRGAFVPASDNVFELPDRLPRPERVAVLADRWCASSCESFVWTALQSEKTTVFGENTGGFLDYGDVLPVATSCPAFQLNSPTSRSNGVLQGNALDNVGIEPNVPVPEDVLYWVDWVHEQLAAP